MERVKQYFIAKNGAAIAERIHVFTESSATVELAAKCLNCEPAHIAKSLTFLVKLPASKADNKLKQKQKQQQQQSGSDAGSPVSASSPTTLEGAGDATGGGASGNGAYPVMIVAAGDAKVNTKKYKAKFSCTPKMFKREEVEEAVGHPAGGVCPFALNPAVRVFLDVSLRRFEKVYPACGTGNTGISLSCEELEAYADNFVEWVDLCEGWQAEEEGAAAVDGAKGQNEESKKAEAA